MPLKNCKLLAHIICKHILTHLEKYNILTSLNHGFRSGYSCDTQLIVTLNDLLQSYDQNNAFEKSSITTPVCLFWSYDCSRSFKVTIICVSHEYPDLNPWFKDVIPNILLKTCAKTLAPGMTKIFQKSIDYGELTDDCVT
jgi:hypothetical protein